MVLIPCPRCKVEKPQSEFYMKTDRRTPRPMYPCKVCKAEIHVETYKRKRPKQHEGMKHCGKCGQTKPFKEFGVNRARPDGRQAYCRPCFLDYRKDYNGSVETEPLRSAAKRCTLCHVEKPLKSFRADRRTADGRVAYCHPCHDEWLQSRWGRRLEIPSGCKKCARCHHVKPVDEFFRDAARHDGLRSYCKVCHPNVPSVKKQARPEKEIPRRARYLRERRRTNPEVKRRDDARLMTGAAIRLGILVPQPCEVCGTSKVVAHHTDYAKPLDVRWLCDPHHLSHGHAGAFSNPPQ